MKEREVITHIMPAGSYYVGDPCYVIPNEKWDDWLDAAYLDLRADILLAPLDGLPVLAFTTQYGDGNYPGSFGKFYPVDAGLIGVVPVACRSISTYDPRLTQVYTWGEDFECSRDENGTLVFGHIAIVTGDDGWDEDDDEFSTIL